VVVPYSKTTVVVELPENTGQQETVAVVAAKLLVPMLPTVGGVAAGPVVKVRSFP
jgi:hypothetical protein